MNTTIAYIPQRAARQRVDSKAAARALRFDWIIVMRIGLAATALTIACLAVWAVAQAVPARSADVMASIGTVVVQPGDTLWSIAKRIGGEARDPRAVVELIRNMNGIEGSLIWPGQELVVPADV